MNQVVLFDWGDTVMRVFPEYEGPMACWPRVEAVPGVAEALRALQPRCRLVLATNAPASGAAPVRQALARVGLEGYFQAVFTARELGVRKPEPAFFQAMLRELGCAPHDATMVGDEYPIDVVGAKAAGLRAVWFNPLVSPCPLIHPLHDAEVHTLAELPSVLEDLHLPDIDECLALLAEQEVVPRVLEHSQAAAAVAFRLAAWLRELGEQVDPLLAHRGGLLHDLDKVTSRRLNQTHGQVSARILREKGYPDLANIAERHLIFTILEPASRPATWEEKLVYYVDKIVEDKPVGLARRLEGLRQRYPAYAEEYDRCAPFLLALEAEICARLGVSPATLLDRMNQWT
jgi:putative hydrolase of the HAD superfamily